MRLKSYTAAPLLCAMLYLLSIAADSILSGLDLNTGKYLLAAGLTQAAVCFMPLLLYRLLGGRLSVRRRRLAPPTAVSLPCLGLLALILFLGSMLLSMLTERLGIAAPAEAVRLPDGAYGTGALLVLTLTPAVCEEILFRGVVMPMFEPCGTAPAIIGTSLLFTFAHMQIEHFFEYFFSSVVLCFAVYVSRSLFSSILLHFLYNAASILLAGYVSGVAEHLESFALLFLVMLFAVWILTLFALSSAQRVFHVYAIRGADSSYTPQKMTRAERLRAAANVYFSIPFLLCALIYTAVVILTLR